MLSMPYRPEPRRVLRARFAEAFRECVDLRQCKRSYQHVREANVFDFIDGIRIFTRRELHPDPVGQVVLVCADIDPESHLAYYLAAHPAGRIEFELIVAKRYAELCGCPVALWTRRKRGETSPPYWYHSPADLGLTSPDSACPSPTDATS